jgi:hypothetical protein
MFRLYALAAIATVAIPVFSSTPYNPDAFPSQWVPVFLALELLISAFVLKSLYPQSDLVRCLTFGLVFVLVRMVACLLASLLDETKGKALWDSVGGRWADALIPTIIYMYGHWWVALAQYVAVVLWMPTLLSTAVPGFFATQIVLSPPAAAAAPPVAPAAPELEEPNSFRDLERYLSRYKGLIGWMVFAPDRLPVWRAGADVSVLEMAPQVLRRMDDICKPPFRGRAGETLLQGMFQTEDGYCILAALPGDFLFSSLWRADEAAEPVVLQEIVGRIERWLGKRFQEFMEPQEARSQR